MSVMNLSRRVFHLRFIAFTSIFAAIFSTIGAVAQARESSMSVQVLAYRDGTLLSQGSGVRVGADLIVSAAHLEYDADRIMVTSTGGAEYAAVVAAIDRDNDLLLLRVAEMAGSTGTLASIAPPVNETTVIKGFWTGKEDRRSAKLFGKKRPRFAPEIHTSGSTASAVIRSADGVFLTARAVVGRGAYGAPLVDDCGDIGGIIVADRGANIDDLWAYHTPATQLTIAGVDAIADMAESAGVALNRATTACTLATEAAIEAAEAESEKAKSAAAEAEKRAEEERKRREEAEREREAEAERADNAENEAEETREITDNIANEADRRQLEAEAAKRERLFFLRAAAAAAAGLAFAAGVAVWLARRRKQDNEKADAALAEATARYDDCLLKGSTAGGDPIAIRISGGDLQHEVDGVVLGRNPGQAQFVVGDDTVSRRHARISLLDGILLLEDLDSTGGTKLNGQVLASRSPVAIKSGDFIELGGAKLNFQVLEE